MSKAPCGFPAQLVAGFHTAQAEVVFTLTHPGGEYGLSPSAVTMVYTPEYDMVVARIVVVGNTVKLLRIAGSAGASIEGEAEGETEEDGERELEGEEDEDGEVDGLGGKDKLTDPLALVEGEREAEGETLLDALALGDLDAEGLPLHVSLALALGEREADLEVEGDIEGLELLEVTSLCSVAVVPPKPLSTVKVLETAVTSINSSSILTTSLTA